MKKSTSSRDGDNPRSNSGRRKKIVKKKTAIEKELLAIEKELKEAEAELQRLEQPNAYKPKPCSQSKLEGKTYQFTLDTGKESCTACNSNSSLDESKPQCQYQKPATCRDEKISPIQSLCPKQKDVICQGARKETKTTKKQSVPPTFIELEVIKTVEASCGNDADSQMKYRITYCPSADVSVKSLKIGVDKQPSNSSIECPFYKSKQSEEDKPKNCNQSASRRERKLDNNKLSDKRQPSICLTSKIKQANGLSSCEPVVEKSKYDYLMSQTNSANDCMKAVEKSPCGSPNCAIQDLSISPICKEDIANGPCGSPMCVPEATLNDQTKNEICVCPNENQKTGKTTYGVPKCKSPLNLPRPRCGPKPPNQSINKTIASKPKVCGKPTCQNIEHKQKTATDTKSCSLGKNTGAERVCKIVSDNSKMPCDINKQSNIKGKSQPVDLSAAEYQYEQSDEVEKDSCIPCPPFFKDDLPDFTFYKQPLNNLINSYSNIGKGSFSNTDSCSWNTGKNKEQLESCAMADNDMVPGQSRTWRDSEFSEREKLNPCDIGDETSDLNIVCYRHRAKNCSDPLCNKKDIVGFESGRLHKQHQEGRSRGSQTKEGSECTVPKRQNASLCPHCQEMSAELETGTIPTSISCNKKTNKEQGINNMPCDEKCLCDCQNQVMSEEVKQCKGLDCL